VIVGGHTVDDEELKYGLAVTGRADPRRLLTNAAARPGDVLVLTKPIGTGILATALKNGELPDDSYRALVDSMTTLNAEASRAALAVGARCATDITGFGVLGHMSHIARASNVTLRLHTKAVPLLAGTREALAAGARTGGAGRNALYLEKRVDWGMADDSMRALLTDPQTSGGLLVAVPQSGAVEYLQRVPGAVSVGEVIERASYDIVLA
jgi:selenide, water dikinase